MYKLYSLYGIDHSNIFAENRLYRAHGHRKYDDDSVGLLFLPCWVLLVPADADDVSHKQDSASHACNALSCVIVRVT